MKQYKTSLAITIYPELSRCYEVLKGIQWLTTESGGVFDFHLNGDRAPWDEFTQVGDMNELLSQLEGKYICHSKWY